MEEIFPNVHRKGVQAGVRVRVGAVGKKKKKKIVLLETKVDSRFSTRSAEKTGINIQILSQLL